MANAMHVISADAGSLITLLVSVIGLAVALLLAAVAAISILQRRQAREDAEIANEAALRRPYVDDQ